MAEIGNAVGGELGLVAAHYPIDRGACAENQTGRGERDSAGSDRFRERCGKCPVRPAVRLCVVRLNDLLHRLVSLRKREKQATEIVDVNDRQAASRGQKDKAGFGHLEQLQRLLQSAMPRLDRDDEPRDAWPVIVERIDARPATQRALALKDRYQFKTGMDAQSWRAMFPHMKTVPATQ